MVVVARAMSDVQALTHTLVALFAHVFGLALIAFGGVSSILPGVHHLAVNEEGWMTDRDFANLFALASISPGPNFLVLTLVGYKAAGVLGGIVSTLALCVPTSVLTYLAMGVWERFRKRWRVAVREGLVPVTIGFVGVSAVLLVRASDVSPAAYAVTVVTAAVAMLTRINPLWVFALAAVLGAWGWI